MKRAIAVILILSVVSILFVSCFDNGNDNAPTEIRVITPYGGDDGNRATYLELINSFKKETGITVLDESGNSNEEWKAKINADFQTGAEPDVLAYFTGTDSDEIIKSHKIVSLEEIREVYPDFASNMVDGLLPVSNVDGLHYAVPVNGYWEALYVNKKVLALCGIESIPNATTTWDEFMLICEKVKNNGFIPIAASLRDVPHYWFEYAVYNESTTETQPELPLDVSDEVGMRWVAGLDTLKKMYQNGYFPKTTLITTDSETFSLLTQNKAAFAIDGSWKLGWFSDTSQTPVSIDDISDFTITYVPAKGERKPTDIIAGISMGYFISRRAWDDLQKREACIEFVTQMTSDNAVNNLSSGSPTALKSGFDISADKNQLYKDAVNMSKGASSQTDAVQDKLNKTARNWLFGAIGDIVTGKLDIDVAIDTALSIPLAAEDALDASQDKST